MSDIETKNALIEHANEFENKIKSAGTSVLAKDNIHSHCEVELVYQVTRLVNSLVEALASILPEDAEDEQGFS